MDSTEIEIVITRSMELHTKISDAIQRSLKNEFYFGRSSNIFNGSHNDPSTSSLHNSNCDAFHFVPGDGITDAKNLSSIRDALEQLEEQLEYLQTLSPYQNEERNNILNNLEQSRNLLLRSLFEYKGNESKVVEEVFDFLGVNIEESMDDDDNYDYNHSNTVVDDLNLRDNDGNDSDFSAYLQPLISSKRFKDDSFPSFQALNNASSLSDSCDSERIFPSESSSEEDREDREDTGEEEKEERKEREDNHSIKLKHSNHLSSRFIFTTSLHSVPAYSYNHEPIDEDCLISDSSLSSPYLHHSNTGKEGEREGEETEDENNHFLSPEEESDLCNFCSETIQCEAEISNQGHPHPPELSPRHVSSHVARNAGLDLVHMTREVGFFVLGAMVDALKLSVKVAVMTVGISMGMMFVNMIRGKKNRRTKLLGNEPTFQMEVRKKKFVPKPSVPVSLPPSTPLSPFYSLQRKLMTQNNEVMYSDREVFGNGGRPRNRTTSNRYIR